MSINEAVGRASTQDTTGTTFDLVLRGQQVLAGQGIAPREIGVRDGKIVAVEPYGTGTW